jgi:hypothetical protein
LTHLWTWMDLRHGQRGTPRKLADAVRPAQAAAVSVSPFHFELSPSSCRPHAIAHVPETVTRSGEAGGDLLLSLEASRLSDYDPLT